MHTIESIASAQGIGQGRLKRQELTSTSRYRLSGLVSGASLYSEIYISPKLVIESCDQNLGKPRLNIRLFDKINWLHESGEGVFFSQK